MNFEKHINHIMLQTAEKNKSSDVFFRFFDDNNDDYVEDFFRKIIGKGPLDQKMLNQKVLKQKILT